MNYIKKNKKKVFIIAIIAILVILLILGILFLMPNATKSTWGNRLDGIKEHKIDDTSIETIKSSITGTGKASKVEYRLSGRTMNFIITVASDVNRDEAIKLTSYITDNIEPDDQSYYDIQVMFETDGNSSEYPFMGYKHKSATEFSYSYVGDDSE